MGVGGCLFACLSARSHRICHHDPIRRWFIVHSPHFFFYCVFDLCANRTRIRAAVAAGSSPARAAFSAVLESWGHRSSMAPTGSDGYVARARDAVGASAGVDGAWRRECALAWCPRGCGAARQRWHAESTRGRAPGGSVRVVRRRHAGTAAATCGSIAAPLI